MTDAADVIHDEQTVPVMVARNWRVHHVGQVWQSGDVVSLPLSVALQWLAWGSVIEHKPVVSSKGKS